MWEGIGFFLMGSALFGAGFAYGYRRAHNDLLDQIGHCESLLSETVTMRKELEEDINEVRELTDKLKEKLGE